MPSRCPGTVNTPVGDVPNADSASHPATGFLDPGPANGAVKVGQFIARARGAAHPPFVGWFTIPSRGADYALGKLLRRQR